MSSEELSKCYNRALFLLGRRAYSSHKLREKLKKDFTPESIERCIQQLVQKKYIDDDAYLEKQMAEGKACWARGPLLN
jgi:SOS response regulatory protein OraA/RecX